MSKKENPTQKAAMLSAFVDYIVENGLAGLSLRPAAAAMGTSPRMLLYYFGSKERLIGDAIALSRTREMQMFGREVQKWGDASPVQIFRGIWNWYTSKRHAPYLRLFFEVYGIALQNRKVFREFLETVGSDFQTFAEAAFVSRGYSRRSAQAVATLHLASMRGLLMDYATTRDRTRVNDAMAMIAESLEKDWLRPPARPIRRKTRRGRRVSRK